MEIERFVTDQATYQLARMVLGWALINMKNSRPLPFGSREATFWNYTQGGELTAATCVHSRSVRRRGNSNRAVPAVRG